jgi:uncharacterized protein YdhG (YjbR/CyaY superfamily)
MLLVAFGPCHAHAYFLNCSMKTNIASVDECIASYPAATQKVLKQVRATIKKAAPDAEEMISYGMPAYKLNGKPLVYFSGFKEHVGFYATPTGHREFKAELSKYKQGKGSVQFPLDEPMPLKLIEQIVKFRVAENIDKAAKAPKKKGAAKKKTAGRKKAPKKAAAKKKA